MDSLKRKFKEDLLSNITHGIKPSPIKKKRDLNHHKKAKTE
jgi:hypothetical protein